MRSAPFGVANQRNQSFFHRLVRFFASLVKVVLFSVYSVQ